MEDHSHAETVRKLVGKYRLSLAEVARRIGVSTSAVSKMLAGNESE
jgi:transcriptional regulator with XRE-family HTH domain